MLSLQFDPFPVLYTERLVLRNITISDVNEIFFLRSDETILRFLGKEPAKNKEEANIFIEKIITNCRNNEAILWGITTRDIDQVIGTICLWNIIPEHFRADVGYVLHPRLQGKGIMNEALKKVLKYGFEVMKLHSVAAKVDPRNTASINLLEKNGFTREGLFHEDYYFKGKFYDTAAYSLLNKSA